MYQGLVADEAAPQLTAKIRSKYAFARRIFLRSPVTQASGILTCASLPGGDDLLLELDLDMQKNEVAEKEPSCDSDWFLVPGQSAGSLHNANSEPMDLSGAVDVDGIRSTHGGSYGEVWMGTWRNGKTKTAVCSVNSFASS